MTTSLNEAATVRDLLFGDRQGAATKELTKSLHQRGTVSALIPGLPAIAGAEREVAAAADGLLTLNLVDLAAAGWKRYDALRQAAKRSRDTHNGEEIVAMVTHKISSSHHPCVEVYVDGNSIGTIEITIQLTFTMAGILAVVERARLTAIRSGTCTVAGSLTVAGVETAKKQRKLDLPGAVRLRRGIALLDTAADAAQFAQVVPAGEKSQPIRRDWYPDPMRRYEFRWWDGLHWTQRVATDGQTMSDPIACGTVPGPATLRTDDPSTAKLLRDSGSRPGLSESAF